MTINKNNQLALSFKKENQQSKIMMMKQRSFKRTPMLLLLILSTVITRAQEVALKTNLLGLATTSLNAGLEIGITKAGMSVVVSPTDTNGCCLSISISKDPSD